MQLLPLERRQTAELHVENRLRLNLRELELVDSPCFASSVDFDPRISLMISSMMSMRLLQAFQDVRACLAFFSSYIVRLRTTSRRKAMNSLSVSTRLRIRGWPLTIDRLITPNEICICVSLVELVQDDLRDRVALELDDDADLLLRGRFAVGLVANLGDAFDPLFVDQVGDLFDQLRLVDLERNLGDDDGVAFLSAAPDPVDRRPRPKLHHAAPGLVSLLDAFAAVDEAARREIRPRHDLDQILDRGVRMLDQMDRRLDDLTQVVRRNLGRHADGDSIRTVDQQVRDARRQDGRLLARFVVVRDEFDGLFLDVGEQLRRDARQTRFGVPVGRRVIAIDDAPVSLPVDQRVAHRKILRHPHHRIVDGACRRADDTRRARLRRRSPISCTACRASVPSRSSSKECADGPASTRHGHRAARGR